MENCIEKYTWQITTAGITLLVSLVTNIILGIKICCCSTARENQKIKSVELVSLNEEVKNAPSKENYIVNIGTARRKKSTLPNWVIEDYTNSRVPTSVPP